MSKEVELRVCGESFGSIKEHLLRKAMEKYNTDRVEDVVLHYIEDIVDEDLAGKTEKEKIQAGVKEAMFYGYSSLAEMIAYHIVSDTRPANEICKVCQSYDDQFCVYHLCRVSPFDKGCEGFRMSYDKSNVTHIAEGYVKRGK